MRVCKKCGTTLDKVASSIWKADNLATATRRLTNGNFNSETVREGKRKKRQKKAKTKKVRSRAQEAKGCRRWRGTARRKRPRLRARFAKEVAPALMKELDLKNPDGRPASA